MPNEQASGSESPTFYLCLTTLFFKGLKRDVSGSSVSLLNSSHEFDAKSSYFVSSHEHCSMSSGRSQQFCGGKLSGQKDIAGGFRGRRMGPFGSELNAKFSSGNPVGTMPLCVFSCESLNKKLS